MFYQLVGIANASFYDSQIRSSNQSSLEPTYDKTQVDIRLFNILYCTSKRKTPPPPLLLTQIKDNGGGGGGGGPPPLVKRYRRFDRGNFVFVVTFLGLGFRV